MENHEVLFLYVMIPRDVTLSHTLYYLVKNDSIISWGVLIGIQL